MIEGAKYVSVQEFNWFCSNVKPGREWVVVGV